jgi:hypothetical protein
MNIQSIQITDAAKSLFLKEACLILRTKEVVPFIGPALLQVEPTQKKGDVWPNIDQSASFFGICVRDSNRRLQFTRRTSPRS